MLNLGAELYLKFATIYEKKFTHNHPTDAVVLNWHADWDKGLQHVKYEHFLAAIEYCQLNLPWPPNLAEFREICDKQAGIPSYDTAFKMAISRDFSQPLVKVAYDKVGSWEMSHEKSAELERKFKSAYQTALNEYRVNPDQKMICKSEKVEKIEQKPLSRRMSWSEFKEKQAAIREKVEPLKLDNLSDIERRIKLLSLSDEEALGLDSATAYERIKYKREIEAVEHLRYIGNRSVAGVQRKPAIGQNFKVRAEYLAAD